MFCGTARITQHNTVASFVSPLKAILYLPFILLPFVAMMVAFRSFFSFRSLLPIPTATHTQWPVDFWTLPNVSSKLDIFFVPFLPWFLFFPMESSVAKSTLFVTFFRSTNSIAEFDPTDCSRSHFIDLLVKPIAGRVIIYWNIGRNLDKIYWLKLVQQVW